MSRRNKCFTGGAARRKRFAFLPPVLHGPEGGAGKHICFCSAGYPAARQKKKKRGEHPFVHSIQSLGRKKGKGQQKRPLSFVDAFYKWSNPPMSRRKGGGKRGRRPLRRSELSLWVCCKEGGGGGKKKKRNTAVGSIKKR